MVSGDRLQGIAGIVFNHSWFIYLFISFYSLLLATGSSLSMHRVSRLGKLLAQLVQVQLLSDLEDNQRQHGSQLHGSSQVLVRMVLLSQRLESQLI